MTPGVRGGEGFSPDRAPEWVPDALLPGFESLTLRFPDDYDGPVVATLVRRRAAAPSRRAVLYVHGFVDYFFQAHLAEQYVGRGFNFYALDLRKHGRSLRGDRHPNFCKDVGEYYDDLSAAISVLTGDEGNDRLVLNGHSTGGLVVSLYAHDGAHRSRVDAVVLNSPFFDFNVGRTRKTVLGLVAAAGRFAPFLALRGAISPLYGQSIDREHHGEWAFDTRLKPIEGFPVYFGWVRAIRAAQARVRGGLTIACPVLLLHSDRSVHGRTWHPGFRSGDAVLDVADMRRAARHLGASVEVVEIRDGLHDLALSRADVRERFFQAQFAWLAA